MRFFNLDLHIGPIADLTDLFGELGHSVDSWNMSGHNWVFGREQRTTDVVTPWNWRALDRRMCDAFYERYRAELAGYDAFLVTYPPAFALLFERFGKPIVVQAPIRYEAPFTDRPDEWARLDALLKSDQVVRTTNNLYDQDYAEWFVGGTRWRCIPSVCDYTGAAYAPERGEVLWASRAPCPEIAGLASKGAMLPPRYRWADLVKFRGVAFLPYNVSLMSIFEHYAQGVPMWFPTHRLLGELRARVPALVLNETTWQQTLGLPPGVGPNDYTDHAETMRRARRADFYNLPHLMYYDSQADLSDQIAAATPEALGEVSRRMLEHQRTRRARALSEWAEVLPHG